MLTADQIISTVLMRLGNRQSNAALAAQALLEYDLLMQELHELPTLPNFLMYPSFENPQYVRHYVPDDPMYFDGTETFDTMTRVMIRLAPAKQNQQSVKLVAVGSGMTYVNIPLIPISEDDWDLKRQEDAAASSTGQPTHYLVRETVGYLLDGGGEISFSARVPHILLYPYMADDHYYVGFNGYYYSDTDWRLSCQNLVIAGLGKRMAPYVRDNNMLQLFEAQFQRELQKLYDRDTAIEEEHKPGLRGDLEDR